MVFDWLIDAKLETNKVVQLCEISFNFRFEEASSKELKS